ncbi:phosphatidylglycerophosphatase [Moraxella cuniculi DSM 21768]|uniref:Phosphatidylglycerophosphatase A n=2 Tax=Moraxella cuniculi TaxID=34061 RepID=A0A1N7FAS1_9GAMM|nr:phosphatidylglycerophosphatase A [Moraxella cuniculi]OOS03553.1 phosphatidylglycerophosphatase A [Moraxella cuniculi]SIR97382.1 phosphatidylglycerophosphatase [Moraxella cuniculi DSM 21768]VEG12433.1 Phosphatidylglycerophosphatase A [Moraxella cuniculi]
MSNQKPDIYQANLCPPCPPDASSYDKIIYQLGIGLGSGKPKKAAGTWGTVGGLLVAIALIWLGFWVFVIATILGLLAGSHICGRTSTLMGIADDPHIVWDEWIGMWLALLPTVFVLNHFGLLNDFVPSKLIFWSSITLSFGLFRLFDVLKPAPISWADRHVSGGFGIMLDDILAGIIAGMLTVIAIFSFASLGLVL